MSTAIYFSAQQAFGATGQIYDAENGRQLVAETTVLLATGWHMIRTSPNDVVEYSPDAGVTYRTAIAADDFGYVYSDGQNFRIRNTGTGDSGDTKTYDTPLDEI